MAKKRKREQYIVCEMINLYCRKNHKNLYQKKTKKMCPECSALADYAVKRSQNCPHMKDKTFCSNCKTHCYSPEMREKIRTVMRFSGPRIMLYHPILATKHCICSL
ncbi:MAG: nitrous oxide-stimulated promoter family protein, partial [Treponemataceae bacterium]|nr:nitrous oxide-stimulated promoter family protein [Treponemataceae bacterium]